MLDISPALLLTTGVVFLVLMYLVNKTLYGPLIAFIDNRNSAITRDLENAGKNANDVLAYHKEVETLLAEGKVEATRIKEVAISEAKERAHKRIEQKRLELESQNEAFARKLESDRVEFKTKLLANLPLFQEGVRAKLNHI